MSRRPGAGHRPSSPDYSYVAGYGDGYAQGFDAGRQQTLANLRNAIRQAAESRREQEPEPATAEPGQSADREPAAGHGWDDLQAAEPAAELEPELEA